MTAERQRRYRQRRRQGLIVIRADITYDEILRLIQSGRLAECDAETPAAIGAALVADWRVKKALPGNVQGAPLGLQLPTQRKV